jgi:O-antigen/teichoic acid export membrane protein
MRRLPSGSYKRSIVMLTGGTAVGQLMLLLASPLLSRLYSPEDFGCLAIYTSILSILVTIIALCYERATLIVEDDLSLAHLQTLCFLVMFVFVGIALIFILAFRSSVVVWLKAPPQTQNYLLFLPLSLLGAGTYQILSYAAMRRKNFGVLAKTRLQQSAGQVGVQSLFGFLHAGPLGLILGDVCGRSGGGFLIAKQEYRTYRSLNAKISWHGIYNVAVRYKKFPLISTTSALLNSLGITLPVLLLSASYGVQIAGWYSLGQRIIGLPMLMMGNAVSQVFVGEAARLRRESPGDLLPLFLRTLRKLMFVGFFPIVTIGLASPALFPFVFGSQWKTAGQYTQWLALMFFLQFIANPLGGTLDVLERQDLHFWREVIRIALLSGVLLFAKMMGFGSSQAICLLALAGMASYGFYIYISWYALQSERASLDANVA